MEVGNLWVKLGLDKSNYDKGVNQAETQAKSLRDVLKNVLKPVDEKTLDPLNKEMEHSMHQAESFGSAIKEHFKFAVVFGAVMQGYMAVTSAIKSAISMSIGFNDTMQQNEIAFTSMLGSADRAKGLLGELANMAANTPFELPQLTDATKKLMAFGFEAGRIPGMLKNIGDASSGLGLGAEGINRITIALGQMSAKGKVQAQEMMQLTEAGIPAWDMLAQAMGKSTAEIMNMSEKGLIPANSAIKILIDGMEQRFPNMMDKQAKSFSGLMSTLKDNAQMTLGDIVKPAFEDLTNNILPAAIDKTNQIRQAFQMDGLRGVLNEIFPEGITATIIGMGNAIKGTFDFIRGHQDLLKVSAVVVASVITAVKTYEGALIALKVAKQAHIVAEEVHNGLLAISVARTAGLAAANTTLEAAEGSATVAQWALNAAMTANPVGLVIAGIAALVVAIGGLIMMFNKASEARKKALQDSINQINEEKKSALDALDKENKVNLDTIDSKRSAEEKAHNERLQQIQDTYESEVESAKKTEKALRDSLQKRKQALDDAHNAEIQKIREEYGVAETSEKSKTDLAREEAEKRKQILQDEYNEKIRLLDEETNKKISQIEGQIKAIDDQTKKEEDAKRDAEEQEKIRLLESQISNEKNAQERARLQQELADLLNEIERRKVLADRETQKEALRQQIEAEKQAAKDKEDRLKQELEKEKAAVDAQTQSKIDLIQKERIAKEQAENAKYTAAKDALDKESDALDGYSERVQKSLDKQLEDKKANENAQYEATKARLDAEEKAQSESIVRRKKELEDYYDKLIKDLEDKLNQENKGWFDRLIDNFGSFWGSVFSGHFKEAFEISDWSKLFGGGYASGTDYATSGYHLVGEDGPEIIKFGGGEKVFNSKDTKAMLGGGSRQIIVPVILNGREIARVTAPYMDEELEFNRNSRNKGYGGAY